MLPPFVPPSARVPTELLPLITEFVVDRGERSTNSVVATAPWESPQTQRHADEAAPEPARARAEERAEELALPSIDEFLLRAPVQAQPEPPEPPAPRSDATSEHGPGRAAVEPPAESHEVPEEQPPQSAVPPREGASEERTAPEPIALVQDYTTETPPGEPEQRNAVIEQQSPESAQEEPVRPSDTEQAATQTTPDAWVSEERDSFNWQSAGSLAANAQDERRASEEWSSTDWEPHGNESKDHIVALLGQVARRVRSGELQIHGTRHMTAEAALAAVLAVLLAERD